LSLLGQRWIGPGARATGIVDGWKLLADNAPALFARQPGALAAAVANALVHWSTHGGGSDWLATLGNVARRARSTDELLHAGQVAAWRHGLAHYRESALERARSLDRELLALALGMNLADWQDQMLLSMTIDRWYRPDLPPAKAPRVAAQVGAFVGFGGRFAEPPVVGTLNGELLLHSGGQRYSVHADAYGANVQPHSDGKLAAAWVLPEGWRVDVGVLISPRKRFDFTAHGAIASCACSDNLLVVTHAWSHSATVLALP